mmetsp:Transcript_12186/g.18491  ORF Transcript_12186/g.18491 Transcript_12186/m.18491 type:complete len:118 (-) Transcript_12186:4-357(-)
MLLLPEDGSDQNILVVTTTSISKTDVERRCRQFWLHGWIDSNCFNKWKYLVGVDILISTTEHLHLVVEKPCRCEREAEVKILFLSNMVYSIPSMYGCKCVFYSITVFLSVLAIFACG